MAHETVTISIDGHEHKSPEHTTGSALYVLGHVDSNTHDLFKEVHGHGEDELVPNTNAPIDVKNGEHFFSAQKKLNPGL
jgi:hypothetical protein